MYLVCPRSTVASYYAEIATGYSTCRSQKKCVVPIDPDRQPTQIEDQPTSRRSKTPRGLADRLEFKAATRSNKIGWILGSCRRPIAHPVYLQVIGDYCHVCRVYSMRMGWTARCGRLRMAAQRRTGVQLRAHRLVRSIVVVGANRTTGV